MPAPRKSKGKKDAQSPSALESEKRILQERQRQIDEKIAALNRTIKEASAPAHRMNAAVARPGMSAADKGRAGNGPRRVPKKVVLRAERQEGRLQTLALLVVVIALLVWMVYRYA